MTAQAILKELKPLGSPGYKKILSNHGVTEPCYGVKIADLQTIRQRLGTDYALALDLYETGVYDAMYLAGLVADDARMTRKDLVRWVSGATCAPLCRWTVAWVAAGSPAGHDLALEWIEAKSDRVAMAGWATLGSLVSIRPDAQLDLPELKRLMLRAKKAIPSAPDLIRYQMNTFLVAVGSHVAPLSATAREIGEALGPLTADLGDNSCEVPFIPAQIDKVQKRGAIGKKRKSAKC